MGTDRSRDQYEGILIMDPRIAEINAAGTTATEDSPQTGPITADAGFSTEAVIVASGTPEDGDSLELLGQKAGSPGINQAGYAWREDGDPTWYGWDAPSVITSFEFVENAVGASGGPIYPQPVPVAAGEIAIIAGDDSATLRGVSRRIRAADGTVGAASTLYQETKNTNGDQLHPRGILLDSGRLMVYHFTFDDVNDELQVRMMYTDSPGDAAYTVGAEGVLETAFNMVPSPGVVVAVTRLRVAYSSVTGQFCMTIATKDPGEVNHRITQYASRNGVSFTVVSVAVAFPLVGSHAGHDLVHTAGVFVLALTPPVLIGDEMEFRRIGSAYSAFKDSPAISPLVAFGGAPTGVSLVVADDGAMYAYGRASGIAGFATSVDSGATWESIILNNGLTWGPLGVLATNHSACWYRGYVYMVGNQSAPAANVNSITAYRFGGYSDLTLPTSRLTRTARRQMWFHSGWVGHDEPANYFVDESTPAPGAPTVTRNLDGSWSVVTTALQVAIYTDSRILDATDYVESISTASLLRNSGTGKLKVRSAETTSPNHTEAEIRVDADISMFDSLGGGQIGSTVVGAGAGRVDIVLAVNGTSATGWYSTVDAASHRRTWLKIASTTTLTETASSEKNRTLQETVAASDVDWYSTLIARDGEDVVFTTMHIRGKLSNDAINPDDLFARSLPAIGASYVNDGVSIRGIDGPILRGVEMTMEITHPSPIESILPFVQPSPRKYWLSSDAATDQEIVFSIATQGEEAHSGSDLIGIALRRHLGPTDGHLPRSNGDGLHPRRQYNQARHHDHICRRVLPAQRARRVLLRCQRGHW